MLCRTQADTQYHRYTVRIQIMARTESVGQMCFDPLSAEATAQPTLGSYNELLLNSVG